MKKIITFLVASTCLFGNLFSQEVSVSLSELEVSAKPVNLYSELGRIVTVVEKSEIENLAVQSIDQLLDYVAGVDIRQRGTGGVQSDISIRGGSFDQVLILLNGVNITNPQSGHYNLDLPIDLNDVQRIEVLQGSSARVLGANAFSGAINIITEESKINKITAQLTEGSYNTTSQNISFNYNHKDFNALLSGSHHKSDGYMDNTDYDIANIYMHLNQQTTIGKFSLQAGYQHKAYGANGFYSLAYPNQFDQTKTFFSALNWSYNYNKWIFKANIYWRQHHDWFELFRDFEGAAEWYTGHNYHQTDIFGGKATASYLSSIGKFTLGMDIRNEHIFSNVLGKEMSNTKAVPWHKGEFFTHSSNRLLNGFFIDYSHKINSWYFSAGGAINYTSEFSEKFYGGLDIGYDINHYLKIYASFNTAVRLPTFTDLYYKSATQLSNPDLQPETSKTIELGLKYSQNKFTMDICGFYRMGNNIIDWVREPDSIRWESKNLTDVNAIGGDISLRYNFSNRVFKSISANYSYLHLNKSAESFDSKYALDYLKHKFLVTVNHAIWKNLSASWTASLLDRSGNYSDFETGDLVDYKPYFLLDGKIMWTEKRFIIFADANNITDTHYADYGGLPQPGFNFNIGVKLNLQ